MNNIVLFQICSLFYSLLLIIAYFCKPRVKAIETNIYGWLIIVNFFGIVIDILCYFIAIGSLNNSFSIIFCRLMLVYLTTWIFLMSIYIYSISLNIKLEFIKSNKLYSRIIRLFLIFYLISILLVGFLPVNYVSNNGTAYSFGLANDYVYAISIALVISWIVIMLKFKKNVNTNKYYPMYAYILIGSIVIFIQYNNPGLLLMTSMETFITFLMYFTIENPDVKMINELNIAKDEAVKANAAKTDFLSSMSHEIRTPLNAIVGFSESLKEENLSGESLEEVNDIIDASQTLLEIVNSILDISKIEANKIEIVNTEYNFNKIFKELVSLSKARLGESKPIEFRYHMDASIPATMYGDYARIKQITLNLLTNSIKYTDSGYIDFEVNSIINGETCRLIISVEDSGRGIKKESINKLFTKFERLDEKNTTIEGTGLGLAITKKLVEMMGGKIIVQSIYGKGSKFTVILDQRIVKLKEDKPVTSETVDNPNEIKDYHDKKVLVVDDNTLNLKVASRMLREYRCQIELVDSGFKCIDLVASGNKYDLILMDDMMPKLSGTDTLHRLKENASFNMPVVALTANAISGMREKYLADGFDEYLAKPIEKSELKVIVDKYLGKH
jgi:signal transduction histidine kinase